MSYSKDLEIVAPNGALLKSYELYVDATVVDGEDAIVREAYLRAESEGVPRGLLDTCSFRVPRIVRSGLRRGVEYRACTAPLSQRGAA